MVAHSKFVSWSSSSANLSSLVAIRSISHISLSIPDSNSRFSAWSASKRVRSDAVLSMFGSKGAGTRFDILWVAGSTDNQGAESMLEGDGGLCDLTLNVGGFFR